MDDLESHEDGFLRALSVFGPGFRVQQTLFNDAAGELDWATGHPDPVMDACVRRRRATVSAASLYTKTLYYTIIRPASVIKNFAIAFSVEQLVSKLLGDNMAELRTLLHRAESFRMHLASAGIAAELADRQETRLFLNRFVAFQRHNLERGVSQNAGLDYWIPNAEPRLGIGFVWHDGHYIKAVSVRELPRIPDVNSSPDPRKQIKGTHAGIFNRLLDVECPFIASVEWQQKSDNSIRSLLTSLGKMWDGRITSITARYAAGQNDTRRDMRQDGEAVDRSAEIQQAQASLGREPWGEYSFSVVLHGPDLEKIKRSIPRVFSAFGGATVIEEDHGIYDAWTNAIPGNFRRQVRSLYAPVRAACNTFLMYGDDQGFPKSDFYPDGHAFAVVQTEHNGVHHLAPQHGPVFGVLMFGEQGSGKTTLANAMAENAARQWVKTGEKWERPKILVLDMKDSYRENTLLHGGTYLRLSMESPELRSNPWSLPFDRNNVETIKRLIKLMLAGDDGFVTSPDQDAAIVDEIRAKYWQKDRGGLSYARLRNLKLPEVLQHRLAPWIHDGVYAQFFDNPCDDLAQRESDWLTIQFTGFGKHSYVLQPILYWHWERFMTRVHDPALAMVPKLVLLDEAHEQMMMSSEIAARMLHGLNTGRSYNLWNIFVMQWAHLLAEHPLGPALIAASPVKLFCSAANIDPQRYADIFDMNLHTAQLIKSLSPRREFLRYSSEGAQRLILSLDQDTLAVYSNDAQSTARRHANRIAAIA